MDTEDGLDGMTNVQRETVEKNLGLVGTSIKRMLGRRVPAFHMREYGDELFQEGCLGLIQAVQTFDPNRGMSFATYALPRIRYAMWRALRCCRETIRLPERHVRRGAESGDGVGVWVRSCTPEQMNALADQSRRWSAAENRPQAEHDDGSATVGDMLRRKLETAVDHAVERLGGSTKSRCDRGVLARRLADWRLLVPEREFHASLREIARETRSSYGRVAACEALLLAEVRRFLSTDAEFEFLRRAGARSEEGMAAAIDDGLRDALREHVTERIVGTFAHLPRADRGDVLLSVLEQTGVDVPALLRAHAHGLTDGERTRLVAKTSAGGTATCAPTQTAMDSEAARLVG